MAGLSKDPALDFALRGQRLDGAGLYYGRRGRLGPTDAARLMPLLRAWKQRDPYKRMGLIPLMEGGAYDDGEAHELETRALTIRENVLGPDHWHVALSLANLAEITRQQKDLDRAEALIRRAVAIDEQQFDAVNYETANDLGILAMILVEQGRLDEAESHAKRSAAMYEAIGQPPVSTIGFIHLGRGELDQADAIFQTVARALEAPGSWFMEVFEVQVGIARVAQQRGDLTAAAASFDKALAAVEGFWAEDHPRRLDVLEMRKECS